MYQFVYDFGSVAGTTEEEYIKKIVSNQVIALLAFIIAVLIINLKLSDFRFIAPNKKDEVKTTVVKVLCVCQKCMREQKVTKLSMNSFLIRLFNQSECKYVSLRDIVRAMILFKWFLEKLNTIEFLKKELNRKTKGTKRFKVI